MQTITLYEIKTAAIAAIQAIVPSIADSRAIPFSHYPDGNRLPDGRAALPMEMRKFEILLRNVRPTYGTPSGWTGGAGLSYACKLSVAVSYADIEMELYEILKGHDALDILRALLKLRDPTLPGLVNVEDEGPQNEVQTDNALYCEFTYTVHWHMAV